MLGPLSGLFECLLHDTGYWLRVLQVWKWRIFNHYFTRVRLMFGCLHVKKASLPPSGLSRGLE